MNDDYRIACPPPSSAEKAEGISARCRESSRRFSLSDNPFLLRTFAPALCDRQSPKLPGEKGLRKIARAIQRGEEIPDGVEILTLRISRMSSIGVSKVLSLSWPGARRLDVLLIDGRMFAPGSLRATSRSLRIDDEWKEFGEDEVEAWAIDRLAAEYDPDTDTLLAGRYPARFGIARGVKRETTGTRGLYRGETPSETLNRIASQEMVFVDGILHRRVYDPVWALRKVATCDLVLCLPTVEGAGAATQFRFDRQRDAISFHAGIKASRRIETIGRMEVADGSFSPARDDERLAAVDIASGLAVALETEISSLSDDLVRAWRRVGESARSCAAGSIPPGSCYDAVSALCELYLPEGKRSEGAWTPHGAVTHCRNIVRSRRRFAEDVT